MHRPSFRRFVIFAVALAAVMAGGTSAPAAAQAPPTGTITVAGSGAASVPAETVRLQIVVTLNEFLGSELLPETASTPGADAGDPFTAIVQSLQGAGVPPEAVAVVVSPALQSGADLGAPGLARLDVTLQGADLGRVNEVVEAAALGASAQSFVVVQVGAAFTVADCAPLFRAAREAAIADARVQAAAQAELLAVALGPVVASADAPTGPIAGDPSAIAQPQRTCPGGAPAPFVGGPITLPPFDPAAPVEVRVDLGVNLTFAIG